MAGPKEAILTVARQQDHKVYTTAKLKGVGVRKRETTWDGGGKEDRQVRNEATR